MATTPLSRTAAELLEEASGAGGSDGGLETGVGFPSGIPALDGWLGGGFAAGQVVEVAGPSGSGKTLVSVSHC